MNGKFLDRELKCFDCGSVFVFTAGEQVFFSDKQFKNDPKRCKPCKAKRALPGDGLAPGVKFGQRVRLETRTECSACGVQTTVPFRPTQGRPVLCRECFQAKGRGEVVSSRYPAAAGPAMTANEALQVSSAVLHAPSRSSVSTAAELASIANVWPEAVLDAVAGRVPVELVGPARREVEVSAEDADGVPVRV